MYRQRETFAPAVHTFPDRWPHARNAGTAGRTGWAPVSAHRIVLEPDRIIATSGHADVAGDLPQEIVRVEIAAEASQIGAMLPQRGDSRVHGGAHVHEVARIADRDHVRVLDMGPREGEVAEHPLVRRVAARIERRETDSAVVGV